MLCKDADMIEDIKVFCGNCQAYYKEEDVEFIDIEEDIVGQDVMTFKCPKCETKQRSKRLGWYNKNNYSR